LTQESYRRLISGQNRGLGSALLRAVLGVAAMVYSVIIRLRNFLYEKGWLRAHRSNAVVISIGNITVGGTGKTPLVIWVYKQIIQDSKSQIRNNRCAILTRGYKTRRAPPRVGSGQEYVMGHAKNERDTRHAMRDTPIDEPAILAQACPQARVVVNPDRIAGAAEAVNKFRASVLIMDDGFQHRRLARDLDIVTIDATQPFGFGKVFPAGLLREPVSALKRAHAVVITRCDQIIKAELAKLEEKLKNMNPNMTIARSIHTAVLAKLKDNKEISIDELKHKKVFAFCGIGNPEAFLNTVRGLGSELIGSKIYNDHHHYTQDCLADIYEQAILLKADLILTTQKDWTKIALLDAFKDDVPLAYLVIELRFLAGEDRLRALIEDVLAGKILQE
jgi:tetraacyldisaccharide 4'-kinase